MCFIQKFISFFLILVMLSQTMLGYSQEEFVTEQKPDKPFIELFPNEIKGDTAYITRKTLDTSSVDYCIINLSEQQVENLVIDITGDKFANLSAPIIIEGNTANINISANAGIKCSNAHFKNTGSVSFKSKSSIYISEKGIINENDINIGAEQIVVMGSILSLKNIHLKSLSEKNNYGIDVGPAGYFNGKTITLKSETGIRNVALDRIVKLSKEERNSMIENKKFCAITCKSAINLWAEKDIFLNCNVNCENIDINSDNVYISGINILASKSINIKAKNTIKTMEGSTLSSEVKLDASNITNVSFQHVIKEDLEGDLEGGFSAKSDTFTYKIGSIISDKEVKINTKALDVNLINITTPSKIDINSEKTCEIIGCNLFSAEFISLQSESIKIAKLLLESDDGNKVYQGDLRSLGILSIDATTFNNTGDLYAKEMYVKANTLNNNKINEEENIQIGAISAKEKLTCDSGNLVNEGLIMVIDNSENEEEEEEEIIIETYNADGEKEEQEEKTSQTLIINVHTILNNKDAHIISNENLEISLKDEKSLLTNEGRIVANAKGEFKNGQFNNKSNLIAGIINFNVNSLYNEGEIETHACIIKSKNDIINAGKIYIIEEQENEKTHAEGMGDVLVKIDDGILKNEKGGFIQSDHLFHFNGNTIVNAHSIKAKEVYIFAKEDIDIGDINDGSMVLAVEVESEKNISIGEINAKALDLKGHNINLPLKISSDYFEMKAKRACNVTDIKSANSAAISCRKTTLNKVETNGNLHISTKELLFYDDPEKPSNFFVGGNYTLTDLTEKGKKLIYSAPETLDLRGSFLFSGKKMINEKPIQAIDFVSKTDEEFKNNNHIHVQNSLVVKASTITNEKQWSCLNNHSYLKIFGYDFTTLHQAGDANTGIIQANHIFMDAKEGEINNIEGGIIESTSQEQGDVILQAKGSISNRKHKCTDKDCDKCSTCSTYGSLLHNPNGNILLLSSEGKVISEDSDMFLGDHTKGSKGKLFVYSKDDVDFIISKNNRKYCHPRKIKIINGQEVDIENYSIPHRIPMNYIYELSKTPPLSLASSETGEANEIEPIVIERPKPDECSVYIHSEGQVNLQQKFLLGDTLYCFAKKGINISPLNEDLRGKTRNVGEDQIITFGSKALESSFYNELDTFGNSKALSTQHKNEIDDYSGGQIIGGGLLFLDTEGDVIIDGGQVFFEKGGIIKGNRVLVGSIMKSYLDRYIHTKRHYEDIKRVEGRQGYVVVGGDFLIDAENIDIIGGVIGASGRGVFKFKELRAEILSKTVHNMIKHTKVKYFLGIRIRKSTRTTKWSHTANLLPTLFGEGIHFEGKGDDAKAYFEGVYVTTGDEGVTSNNLNYLEIKAGKKSYYIKDKIEESGIFFSGMAGVAASILEGKNIGNSVANEFAILGAVNGLFHRKSSTDFAPVVNAAVEGWKFADNLATHYKDANGQFSSAIGETLKDTFLNAGFGFGQRTTTHKINGEDVFPSLFSSTGGIFLQARKARIVGSLFESDNLQIDVKELDIVAETSFKQEILESHGWSVGFNIGHKGAFSLSYNQDESYYQGKGFDVHYNYFNVNNNVSITVDKMKFEGIINGKTLKLTADEVIVKTLQDEYEIEGWQNSFGIGLSFNPATAFVPLPNFSVGEGSTDGYKKWAKKQSGFFVDFLEADVNNLHCEGCIIGNKDAKGYINTSVFTFKNIENVDYFHTEYFSLSFDTAALYNMVKKADVDAQKEKQVDATDTDTKKKQNLPSPLMFGSFSWGSETKEIRENVLSSVAEGIKINFESNIEGLNRNLNKTIEALLDRNEQFSMMIPFVNPKGIGNSFNCISAMIKDIKKKSRDTGKKKAILSSIQKKVERSKKSTKEAVEQSDENATSKEIEKNANTINAINTLKEKSENRAKEDDNESDGHLAYVGTSIKLNEENPEESGIEIEIQPEKQENEPSNDKSKLQQEFDSIINDLEETIQIIENNPSIAEYKLNDIIITIQNNLKSILKDYDDLKEEITQLIGTSENINTIMQKATTIVQEHFKDEDLDDIQNKALTIMVVITIATDVNFETLKEIINSLNGE